MQSIRQGRLAPARPGVPSGLLRRPAAAMVRRPDPGARPRGLRRGVCGSSWVPDIFDEVAEDLRAERTRQLLVRYSGAIFALALLAIAGVAGWQGWQWYQARQDRAAAQVYLSAMNAAESTGPAAAAAHKLALADFSRLATTAPIGYRTLARLRAAAMEAADGHLPQALALWDSVAADADADPLLRGLANLLWVQHQLDTGAPGAPWRALAEESLALLDLRQGKQAAARTRLSALANDPTAPQGVRERAAAVLGDLNG